MEPWRHGEVMLKVVVALKAYAREHAGWRVAAGDPGAKLRRCRGSGAR